MRHSYCCGATVLRHRSSIGIDWFGLCDRKMSSMLGGSQLFSPGIKSGKLLLPQFQYDLLSVKAKEDFVRVRAKTCFMWRYKHAESVYVPPKLDLPKKDGDILDRWLFEENLIYNHFLDAITDPKGVALVEADDDEDFTYGILCIVLADMRYREMDWLLEREFGSTYSLRCIADLTDNE